jgi:hypothetical protein
MSRLDTRRNRQDVRGIQHGHRGEALVTKAGDQLAAWPLAGAFAGSYYLADDLVPEPDWPATPA